MNLSTPILLSISNLVLIPRAFSTCTSIGSPCISKPGVSITRNPCIRRKRNTMSFRILFHAVPKWIAPVVYGGPSKKLNTGRSRSCFVTVSYTLFFFQKSSTSSSKEGKSNFFGSSVTVIIYRTPC